MHPPITMNELNVGLKCEVRARSSGCLFITDEVPDERYRRALIFDPREHHFNPLKDIDQKRAYELSDVLYSASGQGENTLTVRNGRLDLAGALAKSTRFDRVRSDSELTPARRDEVKRMVDDVLFLPSVRKVICEERAEFSFNKRSVIYARLNRKEHGERACLILGLLLINAYKGQVVVEDGDFYLRDGHAELVREERLIAGVKVLGNLPEKLRKKMLLSAKKIAKGCLIEDAELIAKYEGHQPGTEGFNSFVFFATN